MSVRAARTTLEFPLVRISAGLLAAVALLVPAQLLAGGASSVSVRGALIEAGPEERPERKEAGRP